MNRDVPIQRALIANPFGIGDVLFSMPLVDAIRAHIGPAGSLGYLCNRRTVELVSADARVDRVFVYEKDELRALWGRSPWEGLRAARSLLSEIRRERYACVFDLSLNRMVGFACWLMGIPVRVGYDYHGRGLWLTHRLPLPTGYDRQHMVAYYLDLARAVGIEPVTPRVSIAVDAVAETWAKVFLSGHQVPSDRPLVALAPGGGVTWGDKAHYKRWFPERYAEVADTLAARFGATALLVGDANDRPVCEAVRERMRAPAIVASGETTLSQLAALLKQCALVIANDGGPLHLAAAVGAPTISIFGPVDEQVYGPYPNGARHQILVKDLPCHPCYQQFKVPPCPYELKCLTEISVEEVTAAAASSLRGTLSGVTP